MALNFETLAKESERRSKRAGVNREPYVYTTSEGQEVVFQFPKADAFLAIGKLERQDDVASQFEILLNGNQKAITALYRDFRDLDISALAVLQEDIWEFWGTDAQAVPGKSKG